MTKLGREKVEFFLFKIFNWYNWSFFFSLSRVGLFGFNEIVYSIYCNIINIVEEHFKDGSRTAPRSWQWRLLRVLDVFLWRQTLFNVAMRCLKYVGAIWGGHHFGPKITVCEITPCFGTASHLRGVPTSPTVAPRGRFSEIHRPQLMFVFCCYYCWFCNCIKIKLFFELDSFCKKK